MPSPLMRMSLARPGACIAPKKMVLAALPGDDGATSTRAPHEPQKRWPGMSSAPHDEQSRADAAVGAEVSGAIGAAGAAEAPAPRVRGPEPPRCGTPSGSPQPAQTVAESGLSASHASHTSP